MRKLTKSLLCLLLICALLPMAALAAGDAASSPRLRQVMTGMGTLNGVNKTRYLLAQERRGSLWGVYTTDGEQVMPYLYDSLAYIAYDCFSASTFAKVPKKPTLDFINSHALVARDGTLLTDFIYGTIKPTGRITTTNTTKPISIRSSAAISFIWAARPCPAATRQKTPIGSRPSPGISSKPPKATITTCPSRTVRTR